MKLKIKNIFGIFNQKPKKEKMYNFFKKKNLNLTIFAIFFIGFIAVILSLLSFSENRMNFKEKTKIELNYKNNLEEEDLSIIKNIAMTELNTPCNVQKIVPMYEEITIPKNKLSIEYFEFSETEKSERDEKINRRVENIKSSFPEEIVVKYKEEIMVNTEKIADIKDFGYLGDLAGFAIALILIILYFMIAFRKLNGFFVSISFLTVLVFNIAAATGLFLFITYFFQTNINFNLLYILITIVVASTINLIFNSNSFFKNLQNFFSKEDKENLNLTASNEVVNKNLSFYISNFMIFAVLPIVAFLAVFIINIISIGNIYSSFYILPYIFIYLMVEISCFLVSVYIMPSIWAIFKHKKQKTNLVKN